MLNLGTVLIGGDAADVAKAKNRALDTLPVVIDFCFGCALGTAGEAAAGLWSFTLPAPLALFAFVFAMVRSTNVRETRR